MTSLVNEISPNYLGQPRIDLALEDPITTPRAQRQVAISVSFDRCDPQGVCPPLQMLVQGPSADSFIRRTFYEVPDRLTFTPREGGAHSVTLREAHHNHWWGNCTFVATGERLGV